MRFLKLSYPGAIFVVLEWLLAVATVWRGGGKGYSGKGRISVCRGRFKWSPALNANTETPDDSRSITGITKLNNFEFSSAESITCWRAYCIDRGQVEKQLGNGKSLVHIVI